MASLISIQGKHREVLPLINDGTDWVSCIPWVFTEGMWRRTIDPGFVNLVNNSRLIHGTDINVSQGKVSGVTPLSWTLGSMSTGSGYSMSYFTQEEQIKSIRFVAEQSRHYYISRIQVEAGVVYTASAIVEQLGIRNQRKVLSIVGETAVVDIEVDFPTSKMTTLGRNSIQFTARTSGIVQFRIGASVDSMGDADVTISKPQVTSSYSDIEWQPTPIVAPFYGVTLLDSYVYPKELITYSDGEYSIDVTMRVEHNFNGSIMLFGRRENTGFSGIGFDADNLYVYRAGIQDRSAHISKNIPVGRLFGLKMIWKKTGNYVNDIRLYLNGELVSRIASTLYSGNIDSLFGYDNNRTSNLTIQTFSLRLNKLHAYNVDEGSGNMLEDRANNTPLYLRGDEFLDFVWVGDMSPPIIIMNTFDQSASIGDNIRFYADATFYLKAQWFKDDVAIPDADSPEYTIDSVKESDYGMYYCEFQNEFGKVRTSVARLKNPNDHTKRIMTENNLVITTEDGQIIITEV